MSPNQNTATASNVSSVAQATPVVPGEASTQTNGPPVLQAPAAIVTTSSQEAAISVTPVLTQSAQSQETTRRPCTRCSEADPTIPEFVEPQWDRQNGGSIFSGFRRTFEPFA